VLVLDEALPWPPDSGKRIRTFELLRRLARNHEIALVHHDEGDLPASRAAVEAEGIRCVPVRRRPLRKRGARFAWDLLRNLASRDPYMVMAHRTRRLGRAVRAEIARWRPDLVHVEWTPLLASVPPAGAPPVCVAAHNVESDIWRRYRETERRRARRAYIALQHRKVERYERGAFARADGVTTVSEGDARRVRAWAPGVPVEVVPNGVDTERFRPAEQAVPRAGRVLFVGALDWRPNQDAVSWYLDAIHGPLRALRSDATFEIVGRHPPAWLRARAAAEEGVRLCADVPDVRPHLQEAAVCAVPLRVGGGSRLKICEALACERPVVSTPVGAEGLEVDGAVRLAEGAEAFTQALRDVLAKPEEAARRAAEGRRQVLAHHAWDGIAPRQAAFWERLANGDAR
jgi:glycosyltransferase involved in cell wall biosynthesis